MTPELSVILFAYNEASNMTLVLDDFGAWAERFGPERIELLVVDDGATDGTGELAKRYLQSKARYRWQLLRHPQNCGIGAALRTGIAAAQGTWVSFLPADGQISAFALTTLYGATKGAAGETPPVAVFSEYGARDDGALRALLSAGVRGLITAVHQVRLRSDGPYLFRRTLFDANQLRSTSFFLNFEFPIRLMQSGLPTKRVVIHCAPRASGHSKCANWRRSAWVARELLTMRLEGLKRTPFSAAKA